ncbi:P-loop containing nucleoside triphosphate hydrolase protein, partial [Conidiobolus coronatus NRRL 28638]
LNQIFKTFNLKKEFRLNFYKVLISIALLIKCDFYHHDEDDFVLVKNQNYLEDVSELLGVQVDDLELVLVARTRVVNDEVCTMMLDLEEAQRQRDQLCTTLFRLAFSWIVEAIN